MKKRLNKKKAKNKKISLLLAILVICALLILSFRFDFEIVKFVNAFRNPLLDSFMLWITYAGSTISVLFILTSLFLWREHKRRWILPLWGSLFLSIFLTGIIKIVIGRTRPFAFGLGSLSLLTEKTSQDTSFPSSHAAVSFSALPILDKEFPRFKFVWLGFACLVAFSRIYFALHYLSDVIAGALIGYFTGYFFVKLEEKYKYSNLIDIIRKR